MDRTFAAVRDDVALDHSSGRGRRSCRCRAEHRPRLVVVTGGPGAGKTAESARQAHVIDERIAEAWSDHPNRVMVPSTHDFMTKAALAVAAIQGIVPSCCAAPAET
jgi:hypothetical protein